MGHSSVKEGDNWLMHCMLQAWQALVNLKSIAVDLGVLSDLLQAQCLNFTSTMLLLIDTQLCIHSVRFQYIRCSMLTDMNRPAA